MLQLTVIPTGGSKKFTEEDNILGKCICTVFNHQSICILSGRSVAINHPASHIQLIHEGFCFPRTS